MSMDGGSTSGAIDSIKADASLDFSHLELSMLGSLVPIGMTLSSIFWGRALQIVPSKLLVVAGLGVNAASTVLFGTLRSKRAMIA
eukprot:CAMPEP_0176130320 /NCGR_PEP_ID=MMETSP0120_2-20121206/65936_1 /TAXON_ID=160619 /ORGANISM="Kryptoperidinium foliaceum, Strain CCMP 1326" /LENGTH=84 /DNA_ID=CAMNT_0017465605 /DNA_START=34 /DNA_END=285 /DNA_ORIENTATION=+